MTQRATCRTCPFFDRTGGDKGFCRVDPPRGDLGGARWPVTNVDQWCGRHPDLFAPQARTAPLVADPPAPLRAGSPRPAAGPAPEGATADGGGGRGRASRRGRGGERP